MSRNIVLWLASAANHNSMAVSSRSLLLQLIFCGCRWMTDDFFAEQRISGANPLKMRVLERDDPRVEILSYVDLDFNLKSELAAKNIYVCDYSGTDPTYRGPVMVAVRAESFCVPKICIVDRNSRLFFVTRRSVGQ